MASESSQSLWSRDFVINLLVAHLLLAGFFSLFMVVPGFIDKLGGKEWEIGVIIATFGLAGVIFRPMAGKWILKSGPKRVIMFGILIFVGTTVLYIPLPSEWWIVPVRMAQGVGLAIAPVATSTVVANLAPESRRGEGMSYMGNSISIAQLYAPPIGFFIADSFSFSLAFIVASAVALVSFFVCLTMSDSRTRMPITPQNENEMSDAPFISRAAIFPTLIFLTYAFTMAPVSTFLPMLSDVRELGVNPGFYFTILSGMTMLTTLVSGRIADKFGRSAVIIPGLTLVSVAMFMLSGSFTSGMFFGAAFFHGVGYGLIYPGINSLVIDRVPANERGSAIGTLQQAWDIGASGGNFIVGPIIGALGVGSAFVVVGAGVATGVVGFITGNRKSKNFS
ncbi:MAG TPA: MFS transporter [SAR202 cluster bacterium]|jgi:MFS family permease|nr:MFS transporter [SAR202 cluster bacterium]HJO59453.1 MFS transporter [SAR202 cluster bacterium]|tara:strand:+ start:30863 stop:32041 length:1179 start_codon:yes stop_codon:yes gene_type:complete